MPVLEVGWVDAAGLRALDALEPDVAAIACFPWLLPRPWRDRPPRGCVNLHPSLLPAYRGPGAALLAVPRRRDPHRGQPPRRGWRGGHRQRDRAAGGALPGRDRHHGRGDPDRPRRRAPAGRMAGRGKDRRPAAARRGRLPQSRARRRRSRHPRHLARAAARSTSFAAPRRGGRSRSRPARGGSPSTRRWRWTRRRLSARAIAPPGATCWCSSRTASCSPADAPWHHGEMTTTRARRPPPRSSSPPARRPPTTRARRSRATPGRRRPPPIPSPACAS